MRIRIGQLVALVIIASGSIIVTNLLLPSKSNGNSGKWSITSYCEFSEIEKKKARAVNAMMHHMYFDPSFCLPSWHTDTSCISRFYYAPWDYGSTLTFTGIAIAPNWIVTVQHDIPKPGSGNPIYFSNAFKRDACSAGPICVDEEPKYRSWPEYPFQQYPFGDLQGHKAPIEEDFIFYKLDSASFDKNDYIPASEWATPKYKELVYSLGYLGGKPLVKVVGRVEEIISDDLFRVSLDFKSGSSGSAIFNSEHQLIGMVIQKSRAPYNNCHSDCSDSNNLPEFNPNCTITAITTNLISKHLNKLR